MPSALAAADRAAASESSGPPAPSLPPTTDTSSRVLQQGGVDRSHQAGFTRASDWILAPATSTSSASSGELKENERVQQRWPCGGQKLEAAAADAQAPKRLCVVQAPAPPKVAAAAATTTTGVAQPAPPVRISLLLGDLSSDDEEDDDDESTRRAADANASAAGGSGATQLEMIASAQRAPPPASISPAALSPAAAVAPQSIGAGGAVQLVVATFNIHGTGYWVNAGLHAQQSGVRVDLQPSFKRSVLDPLGAHIVCVQEVNRKELGTPEERIFLVGEYRCFAALTKKPVKYENTVPGWAPCGNAIYVHTSYAPHVIAAGEGITGILECEDATVGHCERVAQRFSTEQQLEIDGCGRAVVLLFDFDVAIINAHFPAARSMAAADVRRPFMEAFRLRAAELRDHGYHVIVAGDLNMEMHMLDVQRNLALPAPTIHQLAHPVPCGQTDVCHMCRAHQHRVREGRPSALICCSLSRRFSNPALFGEGGRTRDALYRATGAGFYSNLTGCNSLHVTSASADAVRALEDVLKQLLARRVFDPDTEPLPTPRPPPGPGEPPYPVPTFPSHEPDQLLAMGFLDTYRLIRPEGTDWTMSGTRAMRCNGAQVGPASSTWCNRADHVLLLPADASTSPLVTACEVLPSMRYPVSPYLLASDHRPVRTTFVLQPAARRAVDRAPRVRQLALEAGRVYSKRYLGE